MGEGFSGNGEGDAGASEGNLPVSLSSVLPLSTEGYDCAATDELFLALSRGYSALEEERELLRRQIEELESDLAQRRKREEAVGASLVSAMGYAMSKRREARGEAEVILRKARKEAMRRAAETERLDRERARAEQELARLRRITEETQTGLATFLSSTLQQLDSDAEEVPEGTERVESHHARDENPASLGNELTADLESVLPVEKD